MGKGEDWFQMGQDKVQWQYIVSRTFSSIKDEEFL
jgi:hypothetical protein